jgi:hypothetical protein
MWVHSVKKDGSYLGGWQMMSGLGLLIDDFTVTQTALQQIHKLSKTPSAQLYAMQAVLSLMQALVPPLALAAPPSLEQRMQFCAVELSVADSRFAPSRTKSRTPSGRRARPTTCSLIKRNRGTPWPGWYAPSSLVLVSLRMFSAISLTDRHCECR